MVRNFENLKKLGSLELQKISKGPVCFSEVLKVYEAFTNIQNFIPDHLQAKCDFS